MPAYVELRDSEGRMRGMPDPAGGTFDAAGDFDRSIDLAQLRYMDARET